MAEVAGKTNVVYWLAGATPIADGTGVKINGVDNATYNHLADMLDISQFGDNYRSRIAGLLDVNFSLSGNFDSADASQTAMTPGAEGYIGIYPNGISEAGTQAPVIIESVEWSADVGDKQTFTISAQGNGAPVTLPAQS